VIRWCSVAALLAAAGCEHAPANNLHLALVDYWPEQQLLFVGSLNSNQIDVLRVPSSPRAGPPDYFDRITIPTRSPIKRIVVDGQRGRLWAADLHGVHVYPLKPPGSASVMPGPATVIPIPSIRYDDRINDIGLDAHGNAFVYTRGSALIYRIDGATLTIEEWLRPFKARTDAGALLQPRVIHSKDGLYALVQSPRDARLIRIDLRTRKVTPLDPPLSLNLQCGLLLWADDWGDDFMALPVPPFSGTIKALDCEDRWIADIALDEDLRITDMTVLNRQAR